MESRAKFLGHPIHQALIVFPLGLLATSVVFDAVHLAAPSPSTAQAAFWMLAAGLIGGLAAAPFGWIDWFAIPDGTRAKTIGLIHGLANMVAMAVFAAALYLRWGTPEFPPPSAAYTSFAGAVLAVAGGWLGGELVARLGVGVDDGAHLDSPNSLSGRPASERSGAP